MTLPTASELDAWLAGCAAGIRALAKRRDVAAPPLPNFAALDVLRMPLLRWFRAHNDAAVHACPNLPELERRLAAARSAEEVYDALRALLAARDTVMAHAENHAAVQAQAVEPLQLGLHPTGVGDAKPKRCTATSRVFSGPGEPLVYQCALPAGHTGSHHGGSS